MRLTRLMSAAATVAIMALVPLVTHCQAQTPQDGPSAGIPPTQVHRRQGVGGDRGGRAGAPVGARVPAGRPDARHRAAGRLRIVRPTAILRAARGVPEVYAQRPGRAARRRARPEVRGEPAGLPLLLRAGRRGRPGRRWRAAGWAAAGWRRCRSSTGSSPRSTAGHFGSRIVFAEGRHAVRHPGRPAGLPGAGAGPESRIGKVVRINRDGSIPKDNPFVGTSRRSAGDLVVRPSQRAGGSDPSRDRRVVDRGAWRARRRRAQPSRGGQELRLAGHHLRPWTTPARGSARARRRQGLEQPVYYWDPVIAPSGMACLHRRQVSRAGRGACSSARCSRARWCGSRWRTAASRREERYLGALGERIRDVQQGPDGLLYLMTDEDDGRILRLEPKP